jgi:hypothetical protein
MVPRQDAIAVGEQNVWRRRCGHALVPAAGQAEACVRVRGEGQGEIGPPREVRDHTERFVARPIVGDDDLEAAGDALLRLQ